MIQGVSKFNITNMNYVVINFECGETVFETKNSRWILITIIEENLKNIFKKPQVSELKLNNFKF